MKSLKRGNKFSLGMLLISAIGIVAILLIYIYKNELSQFFKHQEYSQSYTILSKDDIEKEYVDWHWRCFPIKYFWFDCDLPYLDNIDKFSCGFYIDTETDVHSYTLNHAIEASWVRDMAKRTIKIIKNQKDICLNGFGNLITIQPDGRRHNNWTFVRMKTATGYLDYFDPDWRPAEY